MHSVDVCFAEEGSGERDDRGNANLCGLSKLALVTSIDVPLDVAVESGPPKAVEKGAPSRINPLVSKVIVGSANDGGSVGEGNEKLVAAV